MQAVGLVDLLGLLREPDRRNVVEPEVLQHLEPRVQLAAAAVDQDQIGQHAPQLERLGKAPRQHLAQRGEIVGAGDAADAEAFVVVLLHTAVFPDDHRADLLRPLDVRDVVALDAIGQPRQPERALELFEHELLAVVAGQEPILERDRGVGLGHRDELSLGPPLRRQHLHAAARELREPLTGELRLRHLLGQQYFRGRGDRFAVELADERRQDLAIAPPGHAVEEERLLPDQPALAHEEQLHARVVALPHDPDDVLIHVLDRDDLLALANLVQGLDLVAEDGGALELEVGRRLFHLLGEPLR